MNIMSESLFLILNAHSVEGTVNENKTYNQEDSTDNRRVVESFNSLRHLSWVVADIFIGIVDKTLCLEADRTHPLTTNYLH